MADMIIIAGPNGSGKSTIFPAINSVKKDKSTFEPEKIKPEYFINADNYSRTLKISDVEAGKKEIEMIKYCIDNNISFAVESTLSGKSLLSHIRNAKEKNFQIFIVYVYVDSPELSMVRVTQRALLGKHYIPMNNILLRYNRSFVNFFTEYRTLADFWIVVDNSSLQLNAVCWGGIFFQIKNRIQCESVEFISSLNAIFERNNIDFKIDLNSLSYDDEVTKNVISKIRLKIHQEIKKRPDGNYVSVSNNGKIEFKKAKYL